MMSSLRGRLVMSVGMCILAVSLLSATSVLFVFESSLRSEFDRTLLERAESISHLIELEETGITFEWLEGDGNTLPISESSERLFVWNQNRLIQSCPTNAVPITPRAGEERLFYDSMVNDRPARTIELSFVPRSLSDVDNEPASTEPPSALRLVLARSTADLAKTVITLRSIVCVIGVLGVISTVGLLWWVVGYGLTPLNRATELIGKLSPEKLDDRLIDVQSEPSELKPLLDTINQLLARLEQAFEREQTFSMDVAHEVRTPLAGLRAQLDLALSRPRTSEQYLSTIRQCLKITEQTSSLVESLLKTTRAFAGSLPQMALNIEPVISGLITEFRERIEERHLQLTLSIMPSDFVLADRECLHLVLRNLIENAVCYADEATTVFISTARDEQSLVLSISNYSRSFPSQHIDKVFQRFWQADASRHQTGQHFGLGLAIARRLTNQMNGTLTSSFSGEMFRIDLSLVLA